MLEIRFSRQMFSAGSRAFVGSPRRGAMRSGPPTTRWRYWPACRSRPRLRARSPAAHSSRCFGVSRMRSHTHSRRSTWPVASATPSPRSTAGSTSSPPGRPVAFDPTATRPPSSSLARPRRRLWDEAYRVGGQLSVVGIAARDDPGASRLRGCRCGRARRCPRRRVRHVRAVHGAVADQVPLDPERRLGACRRRAARVGTRDERGEQLARLARDRHRHGAASRESRCCRRRALRMDRAGGCEWRAAAHHPDGVRGPPPSSARGRSSDRPLGHRHGARGRRRPPPVGTARERRDSARRVHFG